MHTAMAPKAKVAHYERIAAHALPEPFCNMHNGDGWLDEALCELLRPGELILVREIYMEAKKELAADISFRIQYEQLKDEPDKQARLKILHNGSKISF